MKHIKKRYLLISVMCLTFMASMSAFAKEGNDVENEKVYEMVEVDLKSGTVTEQTYEIDPTLTDSSAFIDTVSPQFLEPLDVPNSLPFSAIGLLKCKYEGGLEATGTGYVVADRLVLTAAHNVMSYLDGGGKATKLDFYAGYDYSGSYIAHASATTFYLSGGWSSVQDGVYDWALIKLDRSVSGATGLITCKVPGNLKGQSVMVVGYPEGFENGNGFSQCISEGNVYKEEDRFMWTYAEGRHGMSGGPVLSLEGNTWRATGVIEAKNVLNQVAAVKMHTTIVNMIKNYL